MSDRATTTGSGGGVSGGGGGGREGGRDGQVEDGLGPGGVDALEDLDEEVDDVHELHRAEEMGQVGLDAQVVLGRLVKEGGREGGRERAGK